ncbi:hypothetical protein D3C71_1657350 [compost metagenome]
MIAILYGKDADEQHFHLLYPQLPARSDLGGDGKEQKIGAGNAVQGSREGHRNRRAEVRRISQVPEHTDKSHDGADDSHGRRIAARGFEQLGAALMLLLLRVHLELQDLPNLFGIGAVDD